MQSLFDFLLVFHWLASSFQNFLDHGLRLFFIPRLELGHWSSWNGLHGRWWNARVQPTVVAFSPRSTSIASWWTDLFPTVGAVPAAISTALAPFEMSQLCKDRVSRLWIFVGALGPAQGIFVDSVKILNVGNIVLWLLLCILARR